MYRYHKDYIEYKHNKVCLGYFYGAALFVLFISKLFPLRGPMAEFSRMNTVSSQKRLIYTICTAVTLLL